MRSKVEPGGRFDLKYSNAPLLVKRLQHRATALVSSVRVVEPKAPGEEIVFPENLSEVPSRDLSDLHGKLRALIGYLQYRVAVLNGAAALAAREQAHRLASVYQYYDKSRELVTDKRNLAEADRKYNDLADASTLYKVDATILSAVLRDTEEKAVAISRELNRRSNSHE